MSASKFAIPVAIAVVCVASTALADRTNEIWIKNPKRVTVAIDYALGNSTDCNLNRTYTGTKAIPAGETLKLQIKPPHPKFACLRVSGTRTWSRESLAGGKDYSLTIR
jgi:hypothetical protein